MPMPEVTAQQPIAGGDRSRERNMPGMVCRRWICLTASAFAVLATAASSPAAAQGQPVRIGGLKLDIVFRDDGSTPGDAVRVAEELLTRENVSFLVGTFLSNIGLAVADFANQKKVLFVATEPLTDAITMGSGNRFTFRVRPSTYMQTKMLVEAVKAKGIKKWAIVAPNYEYGQSAAANCKKLIKAATPDAEIVGEQFPALGKIDAGATVAAL